MNSSDVSTSVAPTLKSAACSAACLRSSAISSTLPGTGSSCFLKLRRSALSRCLCCRVCSFWRFVNVDRPLGICSPPHRFIHRSQGMVSLTRRAFPSKTASETDGDVRDSRHAHGRFTATAMAYDGGTIRLTCPLQWPTFAHCTICARSHESAEWLGGMQRTQTSEARFTPLDLSIRRAQIAWACLRS